MYDGLRLAYGEMYDMYDMHDMHDIYYIRLWT